MSWHLVSNTPQTKEDKIMLGNMSSPSIRDKKNKKSKQVYMISKFNISGVEYGH
jgi:hypothetical protein